MQCRYGTGEAAIWLTGMQYQEDTGPLVLEGQAQVQVDSLVRAAAPFIAGRGNKAIRLPVPVVLNFPDWMAALQFVHEMFWDLPLDGELYFVEQSGSDKLEISYASAALESTETQRKGSSVTVTHTFVVAAKPTFTTTSDAPFRIVTEGGQSIVTES